MSGTRRTQPTSGASTAIATSPWLVVSAGVLVMMMLLAIALGTYRSRRPAGEAMPGPDAPLYLPTLPPKVSRSVTEPPALVVPGLSPRSTVSPSPDAAGPAGPGHGGSGSGGSASGPAAPPVSSPAPPPAPVAVTGAYRVLSTYDNAFIGEVLVRNVSRSGRGWTVRMTFPGAQLEMAWIDGAPQGGVSRSGDTWTFTSGADLAPGASAPLRFHYLETRATRPTSCTVDGVGCSGVG